MRISTRGPWTALSPLTGEKTSWLEKRWPRSSMFMPGDVVNTLTRFQKFWMGPLLPTQLYCGQQGSGQECLAPRSICFPQPVTASRSCPGHHDCMLMTSLEAQESNYVCHTGKPPKCSSLSLSSSTQSKLSPPSLSFFLCHGRTGTCFLSA